MDFIKKLKKREFIEMGLKALTSLIFAFIAIILMEGMIYGIYLKAYMDKGTKSALATDSSIVYCIEDGKNPKTNKTEYFVLIYNEGTVKDPSNWSASAELRYSEAQIKHEFRNSTIKWHAPSAFKFTMSPVHYIVISVFMLSIAGLFAFRFVKLYRTYAEIETTYKKTGVIEISNN